MDGWTGYSASGYAELASEIRTRLTNLTNILDTYPNIESAIKSSWIGEDSDEYVSKLNTAIADTKASVTDTYNAMARQFDSTYNDWVAKQSASHGGQAASHGRTMDLN